MAGALRGKEVVIEDPAEGSQIHNKGYYGVPLTGGGLKLDLMEAIYLVDSGRLEVRSGKRPVGPGHLLRLAHRSYDGFEIRYIVYRELRQRGYIVKPGQPPLDFRVFPRGGSPNKTPSKWWVAAISERSTFDLGDLLDNLDRASEIRKKLLLAVVDEESDVTYYEVRRHSPEGRLGELEVPESVEGVVMGDRVIVTNGEEVSPLHLRHYFGKRIGQILQLSLIEAVFLAESGMLRIKDGKTGRVVRTETLRRRARKLQPDFEIRLRAFRDLKSRGLIVKTGFKYGSHFRAYESDPERNHAKYLVHAVPEHYQAMWPEVSRAVRLAHGVRKDILLCRVSDDDVEYLSLARHRP